MKEMRWQDRNQPAAAVHLPPIEPPPPRYQGAPAEWDHGNHAAPHWLAKLLQISTSDSFGASLAFKELSWGRRGEIMWGPSPAMPLVLYNDHWAPCWGPSTGTTRCWLCQSFVTTTCRLWGGGGGGVTRDDGNSAYEAWRGPVGSAGRQSPGIEGGQRVRLHHHFHPHHHPSALSPTPHPILTLSLSSSPPSPPPPPPAAACVGSVWQMQSGLQFNRCISGGRGHDASAATGQQQEDRFSSSVLIRRDIIKSQLLLMRSASHCPVAFTISSTVNEPTALIDST